MVSIRFFIVTMVVLFGAGCLMFCIMNNIIIFRGFLAHRQEHALVQTFREQKKKIKLFFYKNNTLHHEEETIIATDCKSEQCMMIVNRWLTVLADESIIPLRIKMQSAAYDQSEKKLILSFEQSFLLSADPVFKKLMIIETLLKTLRENIPHLQEVYLLVNHQPLRDSHIDTTRAWPINGFTPLT